MDIKETQNFNRTEDFNKEKCISISTVIDMISPEFKRDEVAQRTYDKNFNNPESKYYQMSVQEILESWEQKGATSREYGANLDNYIGIRFTGDDTDLELFKMDNVEGDERMEGLCESFDTFYNEHVENGSLEYVNREEYVYYPIDVEGELWYIRGRFDCLFYNKDTKHYVIVDWKSNGEIEITPNKWTKRLSGPAKTLYNLSGVKYTLQVFFYKLGLEKWFESNEDSNIVDVAIVNLPGYDENKKPLVNVYPAQWKYDKELIENIFKYAIKKKKLLDKKNAEA